MWPLLCRVWRLSPGLGVASLVPDRCGDEVLAGVWPCEYCNMERDLSRALNMIYPSNCAAPARTLRGTRVTSQNSVRASDKFPA